jgi:DNA-binding CsgD family transcriptional regulator
LRKVSQLALSKPNVEIAQILKIKPAIVGKRLEHIYPKLGVGKTHRRRELCASKRF